jgi:hypothetical protein
MRHVSWKSSSLRISWSTRSFFNFIENPFQVPVSSLTPVITALCPDRAGIESEIVSSLTPVITALCPDRAGIESEIVSSLTPVITALCPDRAGIE